MVARDQVRDTLVDLAEPHWEGVAGVRSDHAALDQPHRDTRRPASICLVIPDQAVAGDGSPGINPED